VENIAVSEEVIGLIRVGKDETGLSKRALVLSRPPEFIVVGLHCSGEGAFSQYLSNMGINSLWTHQLIEGFEPIDTDDIGVKRLWTHQFIFKESECIADTHNASLQEKNSNTSDMRWSLHHDWAHSYSSNAGEFTVLDAAPREMLSGWEFSVPILVLVKDPISIRKTNKNRGLRYGCFRELWSVSAAEENYGEIWNRLNKIYPNLLRDEYRHFRFSSAIREVEHLCDGEFIFIDAADITPPRVAKTMNNLREKFFMDEPRNPNIFNYLNSTVISEALWYTRLRFHPWQKDIINIHGVVEIGIYLEGVYEPDVNPFNFIVDLEQNVINNAGKARFFVATGREEDINCLKQNESFHLLLRDLGANLLGRLSQCDYWCKKTKITEEHVLEHFRNNREERMEFLSIVERELELVYKFAPHIPQKWKYYNALLKM
jgi:hypothetical protein